jgi:hypothetical protein
MHWIVVALSLWSYLENAPELKRAAQIVQILTNGQTDEQQGARLAPLVVGMTEEEVLQIFKKDHYQSMYFDKARLPSYWRHFNSYRVEVLIENGMVVRQLYHPPESHPHEHFFQWE